jgi:hypothetical protein
MLRPLCLFDRRCGLDLQIQHAEAKTSLVNCSRDSSGSSTIGNTTEFTNAPIDNFLRPIYTLYTNSNYPPYNYNPYSSLMHQSSQYYTPYTYHIPTFYSPYTTPNQGRTSFQMPNFSSSFHSKTSNSALPDSFLLK